MVGYGQIDHEYGLRLAATAPEDDGPIWMVNVLRYRDRAEYADGRETSLTGREANDEYAPLGPLAGVGAEVVFVAAVEDNWLGDGVAWDQVAVVKYPTRSAFIEMQQRADFQEKHQHKEAGVAETIVIGCQPLEFPTVADAADWDDVPHPPTEDDGPYTMVHVIRFHADDGATETPDHMKAYQQITATVAAPNGVRMDAWFSAEGTIVGDGRSWHQVRFHTFPSRAALLAIAADPDRREAHGEHRDTAIADTYAMGVRARINRFPEFTDA